ncbi:MAG: hypothetical protein H7274_27035 [Rhodoferax sp.]|nr:hypothetical protein [Rhodoferax sp.]
MEKAAIPERDLRLSIETTFVFTVNTLSERLAIFAGFFTLFVQSELNS